ncbi:helix-turn-helix domain-containing protein [Streptomyces sp. NPDC054863]
MTTPKPTTQTVGRRQLGAELRRLRTAANLRLEDVAVRLGTSMTRASRMETGKGRVVPKPEEVIQLCELYGVKDERKVQMLVGMISHARQPGWWDPYREVLPSGLEVLFALETDALTERAWEPDLVHGLLQTPDYGRAILKSSPSTRLHDIDDMVAVRTKRQELITQTESPLEFWVILDEQALTRPVGGADVMQAQREHILEIAQLPNVTLQIVPVAKGAHPGLGGAFTLLESETEPPVVYVDSPAGNLYLEKKHDVRKFTATFDLLRATALDPEESAIFLREIPKGQ